MQRWLMVPERALKIADIDRIGSILLTYPVSAVVPEGLPDDARSTLIEKADVDLIPAAQWTATLHLRYAFDRRQNSSHPR